MKVKRTLLRVEWMNVGTEEVPIVPATELEMLAIKRLFRFIQRNGSRATRSAANSPERGARVLSEI